MNRIVKASRVQVFGVLFSLAMFSRLVDILVRGDLLPAKISDTMYVLVVSVAIGWILTTGRSLEGPQVWNFDKASI